MNGHLVDGRAQPRREQPQACDSAPRAAYLTNLRDQRQVDERAIARVLLKSKRLLRQGPSTDTGWTWFTAP